MKAANDNTPGPTTPLRLTDALHHAFPHGGMTVSGLRREAARGRLSIERIAGKDFTTLAAKKRKEMGRPAIEFAPPHGGARRDLEDLRAAINHHAKEGLHRGIVGVWLPEKGAAKERWLTREEAARLLWACWRTREMQRRKHDGSKSGAPQAPTDKYPLRHIARFVLLGLYTGTRAAAIASASPERDGKGYVDLQRGIFYRLAGGSGRPASGNHLCRCHTGSPDASTPLGSP